MSKERIDEFLSWRGRLDDPDALTAHGLDDREATWERLTDRLRKGPGRRRFRAVWIAAAACLILLMVSFGHFFQGRHAPVVTVQPVAGRSEVMPVMVPSSMPVVMSHPPAGSRRRSITTPPHMVKPAILAQLPEASAIVVAAPDTLMNTPAIIGAGTKGKPLKSNQLRVVHINELEGGAGPAPAVSATDISRHFDVFLLPSRNRVALPPPPPPTEAVLLKVELSRQNQ